MYKVESNEILGRFLTASRTIHPGEAIFNQTPTLIGPKATSGPTCLGCNSTIANPTYKCACGWYLCGEACKFSVHEAECKLFERYDYKPVNHRLTYAPILPLRALLLKTTNRKEFDTLFAYESHVEMRANTKLYQWLERHLVPLFARFGLDTTRTEILTLCAIFDTNCFQVRIGSGVDVRGLYAHVSLMAHDCRQNTRHHFDGCRLVVEAAHELRRGAPITVTYTQTLHCTLERRRNLYETKYFWCGCERCVDPTELGVYSGSILCPDCGDSSSLVVSLDALDEGSVWRCSVGHELSADEMKLTNAFFRETIAKLEKNTPAALEEYLTSYDHLCHATHWSFLQVKYALVQMYGNYEGMNYEALAVEAIERKVKWCGELLEVIGVLEPGRSSFRGLMLDELQQAQFWLVKLQTMDKTRAKKLLEECLDFGRESADVLRVDFNSSAIERLIDDIAN